MPNLDFIGKATKWYEDHGPNPLGTALLGGALAGAGMASLWKPAVETARSLGRPFMSDSQEWDDTMDELKSSSRARWSIPLLTAALMAGGGAYVLSNPYREGYGLGEWDAPFVTRPNKPPRMNAQAKTASFGPDGYDMNMNWNQPIGMGTADKLFSANAGIDDPYVRNLGTSIVHGAAMNTGVQNPTLGSVFDSAVGKIQNKLTFKGVTDVAVKSMVANSTARLFAGTLGAVCGLPQGLRNKIVDAGTWAGTISAILS